MTTLGAAETLGPPKLSKACVIRADIGPALEFATTQGTTRAMFPIVGGEARAEGWAARILPGGADFALGLGEVDRSASVLVQQAMEPGQARLGTGVTPFAERAPRRQQALPTSAADPSEIMAKACSLAGLITSQSLTATGATQRPTI